MHPVTARIRKRPAAVAGLLSILAYLIVIGTFLDLVPLYPEIGLETSTLLSHATAIVNAATIVCLASGWYWMREGCVRSHRILMIGAFVLIILFLVLYLVRVGGGGTKYFTGPALVNGAYLLMLGIHILLSIVAVPLVLYALVLGLTFTPAELRDTAHKRVGRLAAGTWLVSLALGLITYVLLEHLYGWEYVAG